MESIIMELFCICIFFQFALFIVLLIADDRMSGRRYFEGINRDDLIDFEEEEEPEENTYDFEKKLKCVGMNKKKLYSKMKDKCSICLEKHKHYEICNLNCRCRCDFGIGCIKKWHKKKNTCPICREQIKIINIYTLHHKVK
jgi:hypothetical protein